MTQPDDKQQQLIQSLNALIDLTPTQSWRPTLDAGVQAFYLGQWVSAVVLSLPNNHSDPRQRISGWKIRLISGEESYVWKSEHLRPPESGALDPALTDRTPPIEPTEFPSLLGKRVYVIPGIFRTEGEGVVERERGSGSLGMIEVRMLSGKIQIVSCSSVHLDFKTQSREDADETPF